MTYDNKNDIVSINGQSRIDAQLMVKTNPVFTGGTTPILTVFPWDLV